MLGSNFEAERIATMAFSPDARMQRLRAEILSAMSWGSAAQHLRPDVVGVAEQAPVRITKSMLHLFRPAGEV